MDNAVAQHLAALRRARGLSQEELAAALDLSRQAISNWERAESSPDTDNLVALAGFYEVTVDELIGRGLPAVGLPATDGAPADAVGAEREPPRQRPRSGLVGALWFAAAVGGSLSYFALVTQPLAMSIVDDAMSMFGLEPSPVLAGSLFLLEAMLVLLPSVLLVPVVRSSGGRLPFLWLAPAAGLSIVVVSPIVFGAFAGGPDREFVGIAGGFLASSVVLKADVLGASLGAALLAWQSRRAHARCFDNPDCVRGVRST
ncbi:MAG: helix-turn-helix transcriptional regulator [Coriobacteriia bacterium]|nr:helix-turn-helix transcriptional regulator [Coriobacteriia bacterium]